LRRGKSLAASTRTISPRGQPATLEDARSEIYNRILKAVLEHRLPPGTRLIEDRLSSLFDTSRSQVREVLARLGQEGIVTTVMHKGAFISEPSPQETRELFDVRRMIEPGIVRRLVSVRSPDSIKALTNLVNEEVAARVAQDRPAIVRLSGEFHILMAECAGYKRLVGTMRALCTLTCLALYIYDAPHSSACREDEHQLIVEAIAAGKTEDAVALMLAHLDHAEASLDLRAQDETPFDLVSVLAM
jgi:DNA-binding GntR family transcriptional regulator